MTFIVSITYATYGKAITLEYLAIMCSKEGSIDNIRPVRRFNLVIRHPTEINQHTVIYGSDVNITKLSWAEFSVEHSYQTKEVFSVGKTVKLISVSLTKLYNMIV